MDSCSPSLTCCTTDTKKFTNINFITRKFKEHFLNTKASDDYSMNPFNIKLKNKIQTPNGGIIGIWYLYNKIDRNTKYILLLHGNGGDRATFVKNYGIDIEVERNICFMVPDYREFGDSLGEFTVQNTVNDIHSCILDFKKEFNPETIHLFGHSLGCAIALEYYNWYKDVSLIGKIILVAPFKSTLDIAKEFKVWRYIKKFYSSVDKEIKRLYHFDSINNIKAVDKNNIIIFHGDCDELIPFSHSEELCKVIGCIVYKMLNKKNKNIMMADEIWETTEKFLS